MQYVDYNYKDLSRVFRQYNECKGVVTYVKEKRATKSIFNLNLRPGINFSSLSITENVVNFENAEFDRKPGFRIGIEAELILPYNQNKWSIFIEPTYQSYQNESFVGNVLFPSLSNTASISYKSIVLPVGLRYYLFLTKSTQIFLNACIVSDIIIERELDYGVYTAPELNSRLNAGIGFGVRLKQRVFSEFRYQTKRDLMANATNWKAKYSTFSIIVGITIL